MSLRFIASVLGDRMWDLLRIPLQLVPGLSSSMSYLCIKIRETPLLHRLRPSLKKFHMQFFSLETSGRRPETGSKEADCLVTYVLRSVEKMQVVQWLSIQFEDFLYVHCLYSQQWYFFLTNASVKNTQFCSRSSFQHTEVTLLSWGRGRDKGSEGG